MAVVSADQQGMRNLSSNSIFRCENEPFAYLRMNLLHI